MCRHLAYLGPPVPLAEVVSGPRHGLYEQSWAPRRQRHGTVNADGFGLGWYPPDAGVPGAPAPARYRRAVPIWADPNLPDLTRTLTSGAVLAAVRDATPGTSQDEAAAAPYAAEGWLFSHNGAVHDWQRLADDLAGAGGSGGDVGTAELLAMEARCDSALLWALLLRRLRAGESAADALSGLVRQVDAQRPGARLNFLLTDGRTVTATRQGDSLWYRHTPGAVLVASEPDAREGWREVPDGHVLLAGPHGVRFIPLPGPAPAQPVTAPVR
ncbi:ergothioneine biosynthesis protein EgtC [Streptomyces sp. HNM0574]|uniref:ergothioneine biosynthesis protein EgtC n=1 Tax=Streptomyces sp. HNM0574 TaxID=2714954 RepID=UPI00146A4557|nr:ergothioneine biosynthesis protein EgtC [Streptomyces sp. HNM0574]NLU70608.1 ergothioneine biosynthesis protein EgtC [Streptomyces sp. HNM0574]